MNIFKIWTSTFNKNIKQSLIEESAKNRIRDLIQAGVEVLLIEMNNSCFSNNNDSHQFLRIFFNYSKFKLYYDDNSITSDKKKHIQHYINTYTYDKNSMSEVFMFLNLREYLSQNLPELVSKTEKAHIEKQTKTQSSKLIKKRL